MHLEILLLVRLEFDFKLQRRSVFEFVFHVALFHVPLTVNMLDQRELRRGVLKVFNLRGDQLVGIVEHDGILVVAADDGGGDLGRPNGLTARVAQEEQAFRYVRSIVFNEGFLDQEVDFGFAEREREAFFCQFGKLNNHVIPRESGHVVEVAHVDAIRRAGIDAQSAKHAFRVVDGVARHGAALGDAAFFVDFPRPALLDVDAIDGAGLGA